MSTQKKQISETMNCKGHRRMVTVTYAPASADFKIPDGLDLEDGSVVKNWWINHMGELFIEYVDEDREDDEIPAYSEYQTDYKCSLDTMIQDCEDIGLDEDRVYWEDSVEEDDENSSHPPYNCDGGCGKIMGSGYDNDCKRTCSDCEDDEGGEYDCGCPSNRNNSLWMKDTDGGECYICDDCVFDYRKKGYTAVGEKEEEPPKKKKKLRIKKKVG